MRHCCFASASEWDDGPHAKLGTAGVLRVLEQATLKPGSVAQQTGDLEAALAKSIVRVEASYQLPFLAHATMEPMNCTVHVRADGCEVWVGTQVLARAQATAAAVTGLPADKVVVHNHLIGGGFGRRLEVDGITRAVQIARHVEGPVKVVWSREEDIQHDMYRPAYFDRMSAGLDAAGMPVAWTHRFAGSSVISRWLPPAFKDGLDPDTTAGAVDLPYALPNLRVEYLRVEPEGIPTAFWRSVGPSHNVFVVESFMDELAAAAKQDPLAYRLRLLDVAPRAKAVLELAAEQAGWGATPPGTGRPRRLAPIRIRNLHGAGRRGRGVEGGRRARPPGGLRCGLRDRGQSGHRPGASAGRRDLRYHGGALRRHHPEERACRAGQLRHLPSWLLSGSGVVMRVVPPAGIWCGGRDASSQPACARSLRHYGCT